MTSKPTCTNSPITSIRVVIDRVGFVSHGYTAVAIAAGTYLSPFRTEKSSPLAPMVLPHQVGE